MLEQFRNRDQLLNELLYAVHRHGICLTNKDWHAYFEFQTMVAHQEPTRSLMFISVIPREKYYTLTEAYKMIKNGVEPDLVDMVEGPITEALYVKIVKKKMPRKRRKTPIQK